MAAIRHLPNAPIREALLDFRVKLPDGFSLQTLRPTVESLKDRFPKVDDRRPLQAVLEVKDGAWVPPLTKTLDPDGYILRTQDGLNVAQFRLDGFTFSRLKPYTSWEEIFPLAMELWRLYAAAAKPQVTTRLAVRYINQIQLPGQQIEFDDYLTACPTIPEELPQVLSTFLSRVVIHDEATGIAANVTQALEPQVDPRLTTVLIDIDAYRTQDFTSDAQAITETFALLRAFKNRVFFSHITEATASLLA